MLAHLADRRWKEAAQAGAFDDLSCTGQPLQWEEETLVPPEWQIAFHLLKTAGLAPAWILLDRQIREEAEAALRELQTARRAEPIGSGMWPDACERFRRRLAGINERILDLNLIVPSSQLQRCPMQPDRMTAQLTRASGAPELAARRSPLA
jgi:hypothetical protein